MQTESTKPEDFTTNKKYRRRWWVIDVSGLPLGRVSAYISKVLRGKHQPYFTPHVDCGDYVIVVNAAKIKLSGNKLKQKIYYRHTGFVGGIKSERADFKLARKPEELVYAAVKRMMPRNALNRKSLNKLKIYAGLEHPHQANRPEILTFEKVNHYRAAS